MDVSVTVARPSPGPARRRRFAGALGRAVLGCGALGIVAACTAADRTDDVGAPVASAVSSSPSDGVVAVDWGDATYLSVCGLSGVEVIDGRGVLDVDGRSYGVAVVDAATGDLDGDGRGGRRRAGGLPGRPRALSPRGGRHRRRRVGRWRRHHHAGALLRRVRRLRRAAHVDRGPSRRNAGRPHRPGHLRASPCAGCAAGRGARHPGARDLPGDAAFGVRRHHDAVADRGRRLPDPGARRAPWWWTSDPARACRCPTSSTRTSACSSTPTAWRRRCSTCPAARAERSLSGRDRPGPHVVGTARFELAAPGSQSRCATRLRHVPWPAPYRGVRGSRSSPGGSPPPRTRT